MPLKGRASKNEIRHPENMSKNPRLLLLMRIRMLELTNTSKNPNQEV